MTDIVSQRFNQDLAPKQPLQTFLVRVRGTVQGVGFRPTVWRIANQHKLCGEVCNDNEGVLIKISTTANRIHQFIQCLHNEIPPLAHIESIEINSNENFINFENFRIIASSHGINHTQVTPDAAICTACKNEISDRNEHRYRYPFTNCTHCGPRLSIVNTTPYDRKHTTMAAFPMCEYCATEYNDPTDRRFHAQPIACHHCGPTLALETKDPTLTINNNDTINSVVNHLKKGKIIAIRGLGGYHLACDATNELSVSQLRSRKQRYGKPFALMAHSIPIIQRYCHVSTEEETLLLSAQAPIVLLATNKQNELPANIAPQSLSSASTLGFMLPYTPLHYLITEPLDFPLVMTSGNLSDEPQITDNINARKNLLSIADILLTHNRDIANRIDDSVIQYVAGKARLLRRARGYAPKALALPLGFEQAPELLAYGGELKATFCLIKDAKAIVSQHQGDLENPATLDDYEKNIRLYQNLYDHRPKILVADQHPEYLSHKLARQTSSDLNIDLINVQHHHAHIASCLAENHYPLNSEKVLGIAIDGIGYGDDGTFWGGEFMLADYCEYTRLATFKPIPMIGGAQAIHEPWRNTYAHLNAADRWSYLKKCFSTLELTTYLQQKPLAAMDKMLEKNINVPLASSCGRLFDAVAAAIGLCREHAYYEGQGAVELESLVDDALLQSENKNSAYPFSINSYNTGLTYIEPEPMWTALLNDLNHGTSIGTIATRFHKGLAITIASMVTHLAHRCKQDNKAFDTVALSGGCFQNKTLLETAITLLTKNGMHCLSHATLPSNDGGLSLGQATIAAARAIRNKPTRRI